MIRKTTGVRFLLACLIVLGLAVSAIPFFLKAPAALEMRLADELFGTGLTGKTMRVVDLDKGRQTTVELGQDDNGYFGRIERIRSGETSLEITVEKFEPAEVHLSLPPLKLTRTDISIVPAFGILEIAVVNARAPDQFVTAGAAIKVDDHSSSPQGDVLRVALDPGLHTVEATVDGFCGTKQEARVKRAESTRVLVPVSPEISGRERARVILDWVENPQDLDAHVILSGHSAPVRSTHIFFKNLEGEDQRGEIYAELDVDWQHSEGFETITIYDSVDGVFKYFVHHFAGSGSLGDSRATVDFIAEDCRRQRFTIIGPCTELFWYVADLEVSGTEAVIIERDLCQSKMPVQWKSGKTEVP